MPRNTNAAGLALYHEFEQGPGGGPALAPYLCPSGVLTIGYGHTGPDVHPDMRITAEEADRLLDRDLDKFENAVSFELVRTADDNEFAAMVSLCFNIGVEGFRKSSVLRRHNAGDRTGAARAFALWNKGRNNKGELVVLNGLTRRRAVEATLYMTPTAEETANDPQRTRAAVVVPSSSDPISPVAKVGGSIVATATLGQQLVTQVDSVNKALVAAGVSPQLALLLLAAAAAAGTWYMLHRKAG